MHIDVRILRRDNDDDAEQGAAWAAWAVRETAASVFVKYTSIIWQDGSSAPTFVCHAALFMSVLISHYCIALHLLRFRRGFLARWAVGGEERGGRAETATPSEKKLGPRSRERSRRRIDF